MSLSPRVQELITEAAGNLRAALHHASRSESPATLSSLSTLITKIENIETDTKLSDSLNGLFKKRSDDDGLWL